MPPPPPPHRVAPSRGRTLRNQFNAATTAAAVNDVLKCSLINGSSLDLVCPTTVLDRPTTVLDRLEPALVQKIYRAVGYLPKTAPTALLVSAVRARWTQDHFPIVHRRPATRWPNDGVRLSLATIPKDGHPEFNDGYARCPNED